MRLSIRSTILFAGVFALAMTASAQAHFLWLVVKPVADRDTAAAHVYFSESPEPDDLALLERLGKVSIRELAPRSEPETIELKLGENSLTAPVKNSNSLYLLKHTYGTFTRGESSFLLNYRCKTGPELGNRAWEQDTKDQLDLDLVPTREGDEVKVQVFWKKKPASGIQVVAVNPSFQDQELETDQNGFVSIEGTEPGLYTFRARYIDETAGTHDGKAYSASRFYTTLTLPVPEKPISGKLLAAFPVPVTSFGAAVLRDDLYVYGGHKGSAHSYDNKSQSNHLWRLTLGKPGSWEKVAQGPRLQGLALVAHDGKLYRIGGFTAKNPEGEDHDLWSQTDFASFDPASGEWTDLPALPEPRSSHDAAVIGDTVYVVGGWSMQGPDMTTWHKTAWSCDLSAASKEWKQLPEPPFKRRALSLAAHKGKLYCIGGMQDTGGPTRAVAVFDPASGTWSEGPELLGKKPIAGFGSSSFAVGGNLYVSTLEGSLLKLSELGDAWEDAGQLKRARFFHRMLPLGESQLVFVAGANMGIGKFEEVEVLDVE